MKAFLAGMTLVALLFGATPSASAGGRHCHNDAAIKIKVGRVRIELGGGNDYRQDRFCSVCGCYFTGYHQCRQQPVVYGSQYGQQYGGYNQGGMPEMYFDQQEGAYMYYGESHEQYRQRVFGRSYQAPVYSGPRYVQPAPPPVYLQPAPGQPVYVQPATPVYSQQAPTGPSRYCDRCGGNHPAGVRCR
jgi:hypothetical protein